MTLPISTRPKGIAVLCDMQLLRLLGVHVRFCIQNMSIEQHFARVHTISNSTGLACAHANHGLPGDQVHRTTASPVEGSCQ